jgi:NAD(P)-dependent dehydrogenase (short-subunit alcohol dehydrogenase family)
MTMTIALITGANKGIGLETARQFGARGLTVLVGARDEERGQEAERALLRRAPAARIVNVSSEVGSITSMTDPAGPLAQMAAGLAYPSSKAALNMITAMYARELRDTPIKVNAANPGYTKTDLNRNSGFRSVTEGAEASVYLATLPADGPSGILWGHLWTPGGPADAYGVLPW